MYVELSRQKEHFNVLREPWYLIINVINNSGGATSSKEWQHFDAFSSVESYMWSELQQHGGECWQISRQAANGS